VKAFFSRYKKDLIIVGIILMVALLSFVVLKLTRERGVFAEVSIDGEVVASYSLSENRTETFLAENDGFNTIVIENGEVYVVDADCKDGLCIHQGKKSSIGETIVCLPHKLVVTVTGDAR